MVEIISGKKQNLWRGPAVLNFFFGGAGVGLYLLRAWFGPDLGPESGLLLVDLLPAALTALGLAAVAVEAGRPCRGAYLFLNVKQSWMSREVIFAALFILLSLMERMAGGAALTLMTAGAGILFVVSQSMILYRSSAVAAWHRPLLPLMFVAASLLHGFGVLLLLTALGVFPVQSAALASGLVWIPLALAAWQGELHARSLPGQGTMNPREGAARKRILDAVLGGALPMLGVASGLFIAIPGDGAASGILYGLSAATILFWGGYRLKRLISGIDYPGAVYLEISDKTKKHDAFLQT